METDCMQCTCTPQSAPHDALLKDYCGIESTGANARRRRSTTQLPLQPQTRGVGHCSAIILNQRLEKLHAKRCCWRPVVVSSQHR